MATSVKTSEVDVLAKEGKYLTFALGNEEYGLEILGVREIIGLMEITSVPKVPAYVKGVINLRGKVIPVIDLRSKFGMAEINHTNETCIIVLYVSGILMGVIVDRVCEVLDIAQDHIEPPPAFGANVHVNFITGMGKVGDKVKILLNIDQILNDDVHIAEQVNSQK